MNSPMVSRASQEGVLQTNKVLRNTYFLLSMTLLTSAIAAFVSMLFVTPIMSLVMMGAAFIILWLVMPKVENSSSGIVWTFVFTTLMGASLGPTLTYYVYNSGAEIIMQALGMTGFVFLGLSAYTLQSKKDFSFLSGFLFAGLIILIVASIINIFVGSTLGMLVISSAAALLFSGFILYDTSRIVRGEETNYIRATISMYLNILNLFLAILRLLSIFGDD